VLVSGFIFFGADELMQFMPSFSSQLHTLQPWSSSHLMQIEESEMV